MRLEDKKQFMKQNEPFKNKMVYEDYEVDTAVTQEEVGSNY